ncbi:MAG: phosphoglucomutase (alpha-D-glucose-1,6-bisphosphate-dependent) [Campylobacterota bacterium]|nr:phosphoglucomutase (alpha-D-glucose-1,6-bisphosphate-dependent) [Campylobacterota bacterium]
MQMNPNAGKKAPKEILENIPQLVSKYYTIYPDMEDETKKISFGTSGHRGSSLKGTFNEAHILAVTQAVVDYRKKNNINGTLFIGMDTHALSTPAHTTALQVLAANDIEVSYAKNLEYTPTPVISHAILNHKGSDGIVITPSHNPPSDGGFKYNGLDGGPADVDITNWIQNKANEYLTNDLEGVIFLDIDEALNCEHINEYDFMTPYVKDLKNVIDMDIIQQSGIKIGADCMGGSGIKYYEAIAKEYDLNIEVFNNHPDFTFSFMHCDKDGKIRMDCSSPYAMAGLIQMKDKFDISFGNDTDFDRHGIVTKSKGLLNPNHYLSVAIDYLSKNREFNDLGIGKTLVSSSMIDRVAKDNNKEILETPVGFKWFVKPLIEGKIFFGGEESAGASFLRFDKKPWSTDKDGIILNLLSVEILANTKMDPGEYYDTLMAKHGSPIYGRIDAPASNTQKAKLKNLKSSDIKADTLAGEPIESILTVASNGAKIGGLKINTKNGWCALRPSGTEDVYKIYAESFIDQNHLEKIQNETKGIVKSLFMKP